MSFGSKEELFNFLIPVFKVRERINNYYGYIVSYSDIWNFLIMTKWNKSRNLHLSDMVNDIINMNIYDFKRKMSYEKK